MTEFTKDRLTCGFWVINYHFILMSPQIFTHFVHKEAECVLTFNTFAIPNLEFKTSVSVNL